MDSHQRRALLLLLGALVGIVIAVGTGFSLVPRVKAVEVVTVVAGAIGAGAALAQALVEFKQRGAAAAPTPPPPAAPTDAES